MPGPQKKPTPATGRTAFARNSSSSSTGLSAAMVREQLRKPFTPQERAQQQAAAAQERRYQQITRSTQSYVRARSVAPQDGPIAYHAQALMRAELKYQAQATHRLALRRAAAAQAAANQTYIRQGTTAEERQSGRGIATQRQIARNLGELMQAQPESAGIASGVLVGGAVASQVFAPELAVARLAGTVRWLGATRTAVAVERVGAGLSYQVGSSSGTLTWQGAKAAGGVFGKRAVVDGGLQYIGAGIVNAGKLQQEPGRSDAFDIAWGSINDVSISSMLMAGLPGETWRHSLRNAVVANAVEWKLNNESLMTFRPAEVGSGPGLLNYGQKVGLSVGADVLAGRYGKLVTRLYEGTRVVRPIGSRFNPHVLAEWRYTRLLLQTLQVGQYPIKVTGGVLSATAEPYIVPPKPVTPQ
ncbi:MAG: hypothetical protein H7Z21_16275 [Hymenobacter sp.]|nr:hypothetical protein [Hymenobacter sp.]